MIEGIMPGLIIGGLVLGLLYALGKILPEDEVKPVKKKRVTKPKGKK